MSARAHLRSGTCRGIASKVTVVDGDLLAMLGRDAAGAGALADGLLLPADLVDAHALAQARASGGFALPYEHVLTRADGTTLGVTVVLASDPAASDDDGWMACVLERPLLASDPEIRERLRRKASLLKITNRLARVAGWTISLPDRMVHFSDEMSPLLGIDLPPAAALDWALSLASAVTREPLSESLERCIVDGVDFDLEILVDAGPHPVSLRVIGEPRVDGSGQVVGVDGAVSDLSTFKEIEEQVRRQAGALDAASFAITIQEADGTLVYWNAGAEQMYGWTRDEAIGRHITELIGETDDPALFDELTRRLNAHGSWTGRVENVDRWGRRFPVALQVTLIRDDSGQPAGRFSIVADISDRVELEERLATSQKLDSLGQLTGGIAHDFNNLLTVILGGAEMLVDSLAADPQNEAIARMLLTAAERGSELTNRLLVFARRQSLQPEVVKPEAVIDEMYPLLRRSLPEHVEMTVRHGTDLWPVLVDPGQLEAALMNVAANARDAMDGGGLLWIETTNVTLTDEEADQYVGARSGDYVRITVADSGVGMPPEVVEHAFEPFFTTKEIGRGNGLGLSMVYGFVQQSEGFVDLHSGLGAGTRIQLFLPRGEVSRGPLTVEDRSADVLRGSEKVLVVEDEDLVREHAVRLLSTLGYQTIEADNARTALRLLRTHEDIDLLFTDVVMPGGMSGFELAATARALRPGLPVVYTSGYIDAATDDDASVAGEVLRKPYRREVLAERLRRALDEAD